MNYLVVSLKAGERWSYEPPKGHQVTWVVVREGMLRLPTAVPIGGRVTCAGPTTGTGVYATPSGGGFQV